MRLYEVVENLDGWAKPHGEPLRDETEAETQCRALARAHPGTTFGVFTERFDHRERCYVAHVDRHGKLRTRRA